MVPSRMSTRVRIENTKYEPDGNLRDWSESKASRANGVRKAAKQSLEAEAREEATEAKRRRLTNGFDAQRSKSSSKAQLQVRNYEEK